VRDPEEGKKKEEEECGAIFRKNKFILEKENILPL